MNCHLQDKKSHVNYKNLDILIYFYFSNNFFVNKLYLLSNWQSFFGGISCLGKLLICKFNFSILKNKEKYFDDHFYTNICK